MRSAEQNSPYPASRVRSGICTITDDGFTPGCAVLLNSLEAAGFSGEYYIGALGSIRRLRSAIRKSGIDPDRVHFLDMPQGHNPNHHKPHIMKDALQQGNLDAVFFIDADIICCNDWRHFEEWVTAGIAVCSDVNYLHMPANHPQRAHYRRALRELGLPCREVVGHANGGFIGVIREHIEIIDVWGRLIDWIDAGPDPSWDSWSVEAGFSKYDQDALNAALMAVDFPVSFVGHEGMSFGGSVGYMVHPVGHRKPWERGFLTDLIVRGRPMPLAARQYWKYVDHPVKVTSTFERGLARIEMDVTAALSRLIAR